MCVFVCVCVGGGSSSNFNHTVMHINTAYYMRTMKVGTNLHTCRL